MSKSKTFLALSLLLAASAAGAADDEHVGYNAERGEPSRWGEPILTAKQKYQNAMLEARNALAEAKKDCRSERAQRKACEAQARAQYERDVEDAKGYLMGRKPVD